MSTIKPTAREIEAVSTSSARFKRMLPVAIEVQQYAASHGGQLPEFVFELTDAKWRDLSETLRELDDLAWVRRMVAA